MARLCHAQVPKLKPGSGPRSEHNSDSGIGAEDEDTLLLDAEIIAPHALGAPAARLSDQAQQAADSLQLTQWGDQKVGLGNSAVAAESAPQLPNSGRRLSPGAAPGPKQAAAAPAAAVALQKPIRDQDGQLLPLEKPLRVCLMTADFPGLPNLGHISTAFTLLTAALGTDPSLKVGVSRQLISTPARHHHAIAAAHANQRYVYPGDIRLERDSRLMSSLGLIPMVMWLIKRVCMMRACHLQVTLLGVSKDLEACGRMAAAQRLLNPQVQYACLQHEHFEPFTVATQPFEQLSHAVLQWLVQHQEDCDVVQASGHPCSAFLLPQTFPICLSSA